MNAYDWLVKHQGKRVRLRRVFAGNPRDGIPAGTYPEEVVEFTVPLTEPHRLPSGGMNVRTGQGIFCFGENELGMANEYRAFARVESGSGNQFDHEFTLIGDA
jgi:hypothetical protein